MLGFTIGKSVYFYNHLIPVLCIWTQITIPDKSSHGSVIIIFCRRFKHFIIFKSYIDAHTIFQGKYESMIQFYIRGVSFVAKYIIYTVQH